MKKMRFLPNIYGGNFDASVSFGGHCICDIFIKYDFQNAPPTDVAFQTEIFIEDPCGSPH